MASNPELALEQAHVDRAYERLDELQAKALGLATEVLEAGRGGTFGDRETRAGRELAGKRRLAELKLGSLGLCFGRIDRLDGDCFHIGRVAVADQDQEPLVIDWRAPVAEPFYRATPGEPLGLIRRRHLLTRGREVVRIDDEILEFGESTPPEVVLVGEGALLEALSRSRTGRMGDIVATIQGEQDRIIRAPRPGIVVVQGGPGSGKTAVALHRAAYLLYTYRFPLERTGVLIVGPNPVFLRYIERVLPSLGETGCRLTTMSALRAGVDAQAVDTPSASRVKGDARMVQVMAHAVAARQRPLVHPVEVPFGAANLVVTRAASASIVRQATAADGTHNQRRPLVEHLLVDVLHRRHVAAAERARLAGLAAREPLGRPAFAQEVRRVRQFREALERMWPVLTPERLLHDLFGSAALLRVATDGVLSDEERHALARPRAASVDEVSWTAADATLLDEAQPLLGPARRGPKKPAAATEDTGWIIDRVVDEMKANGEIPDATMERTVRARLQHEAEAGARDEAVPTEREAYGHVIVDEAQDLSPMQWRMLARRCPSMSMTIVGDLGQASGHWAPASWAEVLAILQAPSASVLELTVNYRTPAEVMELAARVLAAESPDLAPATSVREVGEAPRVVRADPAAMAEVVATETVRLTSAASDGKVGVVVPDSLIGAVRPVLEELAGAHSSAGSDVLDAPVAVLSLDEAKGLEFDGVVVMEPARLIREHPHGLRALYIALTRTTTWLTIVHAEDLPQPL